MDFKGQSTRAILSIKGEDMLRSCDEITIRGASREQFMGSISDHKEDKFAKTFMAKADMMGIWDQCVGIFEGEELLGAIITTISKRSPKTANVQLLHIFYRHRGRGAGRLLMNWSLDHAIANKAEYFRVSSESESVNFYKKIGLRFWGKQKSGCSLSVFRLTINRFEDGVYDSNDPYIRSLLFSGRKGCIVERDESMFEEMPEQENYQKIFLAKFFEN